MAVNTNHIATPQPIDSFLTFWERWIALWNGDLKLANQIIGEQFVRNLPQARGVLAPRERLVELIANVRSRCAGTRLLVDAGPLISQGLVVGRWSLVPQEEHSRVTTPVLVRIAGGTDILRIDNGHIVECWSTTDLAAIDPVSRQAKAS
jgi:hypothetical protein